ncbi:hypothetical protein L198_07811 [Cryptococcus wingfieldii CBS 7118]|uniref:Protein kinase domain-containing protein n=1 Tax=Cryptococcus wingfieldii CBS 7118 TaxID=1295528 RepID=A0A1E3HVG3_9TREE|nr:hypothetical protein L198_07811 [Cryptococcus wingfieldii CBS 7118]ODN80312.1 hypothetical protein L198_07811 [Cryptococcus wingfieldii CBS 7118]
MDDRTPFPLFLPSSGSQGSATAPLHRVSTIPPACIPTSMADALERVTFGPRHFYKKKKEEVTSDSTTRKRPAKAGYDPLPKRPRREHPSLPKNGALHSAKAGPSTSLPPEHPSLHRTLVASAQRTSSSGQRNPDSSDAKHFWEILNLEHVFTYQYNPEVVPRLVRGLIKVVNHLTTLSLDESLALNELVQFLFQLENRHSVFLPEPLRQFERGSNSFNFDTYEQRDKKGGSDVVRLVGYGGKEEGSTALAFSGECQAANIYAKHLSRLAANDPSTSSRLESRIYQYAPPVFSGVLDLAARPDPDSDAGKVKYQVTISTKLGIERKDDITLRDLFVLFYLLLDNDIKIKVDPSTGTSSVKGSEEVKKMLSTAIINILAQVAQEFHVNRCEYINLAIHDFSVTFQLKDKNLAHVSRIVFRDPATAERDILHKDELDIILSGIRSETDRDEAVKMLLKRTPWETDPQHSLFAVLVAGLVLPVGEDTKSMWINGESLSNVQQASATGPTSKVPPRTTGLPTTTTTTDTSQSGSTATGGPSAFKMVSYPAVATDLQSLQHTDTTHALVMDWLSKYRWEEDPTCRVQVSRGKTSLSEFSDKSASSGSLSIPSLTTDGSGASSSSPIGPSSHTTATFVGPVVSTTGDEKSFWREPEDLDEEDLDEEDLDELLRKTDHQTVLSLLSRPDLLVEVLQYLGSGRLWDAYRVKLSSRSTLSPPQIVVAKICNPYTFTPSDAYYKTPSAAADAIKIELDTLNRLRGVQGEIVPRLYGRWTGRYQLPNDEMARLECVMLEDCGMPFVQSDELELESYYDDVVETFPTYLSSDVRQQIIESYERLHKQGMLHGDVNARHILRHPVDNRPRIIDFEGAISISEAQATYPDYDAEAEMERVRWMLRADEEH